MRRPRVEVLLEVEEACRLPIAGGKGGVGRGRGRSECEPGRGERRGLSWRSRDGVPTATEGREAWIECVGGKRGEAKWEGAEGGRAGGDARHCLRVFGKDFRLGVMSCVQLHGRPGVSILYRSAKWALRSAQRRSTPMDSRVGRCAWQGVATEAESPTLHVTARHLYSSTACLVLPHTHRAPQDVPLQTLQPGRAPVP